VIARAVASRLIDTRQHYIYFELFRTFFEAKEENKLIISQVHVILRRGEVDKN